MAADDNKRKYNYMENTLQKINSEHISLSEEEEMQNNQVLREILDAMTKKMKEKDALFASMYSRVFYGGSYYDRLRVGHPEEFDLDLLLLLPKYAEPDVTISNVPGFVNVQLKALDKFLKQPEAKTYGNIVKLLDDKNQYILTDKVKAWIEGLVSRALNDFPKSGNMFEFYTSKGTFLGYSSKSGPAFTIKLKGTINCREVLIDIDLVPCFAFTKDKWPQPPYRQPREGERNDFFIVPKNPSSPQGIPGRYWRLSFQEQERAIMNNSRHLKPVIKFLKKLRDNNENFAVIASYYIKTVFLWEIEDNRSLFNENSLSYVFMIMLKKFKERIQKKEIPYFWNKKNNLLADRVNNITLENISNRLGKIIDDIERHPNDPTIVAKYLGGPTAVNRLEAVTMANTPNAPNEDSSSCIML